jgi:hypothetical protein
MTRGAAPILILAGAITPVEARADAAPLLEEAIAIYRQAMDADNQEVRMAGFQRAFRLFREAVQEGNRKNPDLYLNTGNAALLSAQRGAAILWYRRALAVDPTHARARQNLEHARSQLPTWVPRPQSESMLDTFLGWGHVLSPGRRARVAAICFAAAAVLFAASIRYRWPAGRTLALLPLAVWATLTGTTLWGTFAAGREAEGVITADQAIARAADSPNAPSRFGEPLPSGTEVRILRDRDGYSYVRLADDRDAWIRSSALTRVAD